MKKSATTKGESPSRLIDARIKELDLTLRWSRSGSGEAFRFGLTMD